MIFKYIPSFICPSRIILEIDGDVLKKVDFVGGCNGNLKALSLLVEGLTYEEIKEKLSGIHCGFKSTSCPDQLVIAMGKAIEKAAHSTDIHGNGGKTHD